MPLHIVQRDHNRESCFLARKKLHLFFLAEENCTCYFYWLGVALKQADSVLHAYALMTNHVRPPLTSRRAAVVPRLVIALGGRYVQS